MISLKLKKILITLLLILCMAYTVIADGQKMMSVTVKETKIRVSPSFLGRIIATLVYADRVEVVEEQSGWAKIRISGKNEIGWVHISALSEKKIILKAGSTDTAGAASSSEVALAGKGFNKEVEAQYKQNNNMDYTWVDYMEEMEEYNTPIEEIIAFLEQGELTAMESNIEGDE